MHDGRLPTQCLRRVAKHWVEGSPLNHYINVGCGTSAPEGWLNYDASLTIRLQRAPIIGGAFRKPPWPVFPKNVVYGDIAEGLPLEPGSCAGAYSSHMLEHLARADAVRALRNIYTYLRPDGVFRLVIPDLEFLARTYLSASHDAAAEDFQAMLDLGTVDEPRSVRARLRSRLGRSHHKWMWDFKSLRTELTNAGFRNIRHATFGDSIDPRFAEVEHPSRWENCLGIECLR